MTQSPSAYHCCGVAVLSEVLRSRTASSSEGTESHLSYDERRLSRTHLEVAEHFEVALRAQPGSIGNGSSSLNQTKFESSHLRNRSNVAEKTEKRPSIFIVALRWA